MTLLFYPDAADWVGRIRLGPSGFSFTEAAESGTLAMSNIQVDDPDADISIVGHHGFKAVETACEWRTLFRGFFADRTIRRGSERTGASRVWDCTVMDANSTLQFEVIRGSSARRPKETDTQRLAWLLGSAYKGPIGSSDANVLGYGVDLDKADYTGQTMADVLADCGGASGANYFAVWDDEHEEYRLHYYRPTRAFYSSTCKISNVLADIDGDTVFWPEMDARLTKDPARVYSGVLYQYGEKDSYVFRDSSTVLSNIGHRRETTEVDGAVRTAARATAKADRYLSEAETELDTITVTIHKVPPSRVNLIRAGQRIQVKLSHLPGYTSYTWLRITRRTVHQDGETQDYYALTLELADPKQVGARVRHAPRPVEPDVDPEDSVSVSRWCYSFSRGRLALADAFRYETIADEEAFDGPDGPIHDGVTQNSNPHNIPWTAGVCTLGLGGWGGLHIEEQWFSFDPGSDLTGLMGVRFSIVLEDPLGVAATAGYDLVAGVAQDAPSGYRQRAFEPVARIAAQSGTYEVVIPAGMLVPDETNYLAIAAGWDCIPSLGSWVCINDEPGISDVVTNGLYRSGAVAVDSVTATTVALSGSGLTPWVSGALVSGRTWTLEGWNGKGRPEARVGAVILSWGMDYSVDEDAGTVTLGGDPPDGMIPMFRYQT